MFTLTRVGGWEWNIEISYKTRMGTIREESSHSPLDHPKVFLSARLRLLQLAV